MRGDLAAGEQRQPRVLDDVPPQQSKQCRGERQERDRNQNVGVSAAEPLQPCTGCGRAKTRRGLGRVSLSLGVLVESAQLGLPVKMALTAGLT